MKIRPALVTDALAIAALAEQLGYSTTSEQAIQRLKSILTSTDGTVLVAESDTGDVIGWISVFSVGHLTIDPFVELGGLVVEAEQRGQRVGIGSDRCSRKLGKGARL